MSEVTGKRYSIDARFAEPLVPSPRSPAIDHVEMIAGRRIVTASTS